MSNRLTGRTKICLGLMSYYFIPFHGSGVGVFASD